jgi:hypothetical protein
VESQDIAALGGSHFNFLIFSSIVVNVLSSDYTDLLVSNGILEVEIKKI